MAMVCGRHGIGPHLPRFCVASCVQNMSAVFLVGDVETEMKKPKLDSDAAAAVQ